MNRWAIAEASAPEPQGPFRDINLEDLLYLTHHMRPIDQEEIYNWVDISDPDDLAAQMFCMFRDHGRGRIVLYEDNPAAWIGVIEMEEGVWQVTMGGTVFLPMVAYHCMQWARWTCRETKHNGRILYCDSRASHAEAHKFLLALGARAESRRRLGRDGGEYIRFFWRYGENDAGVSRTGMPNSSA